MISVVNIVPRSRSDETFQDCEPNIAVNPANPLEIVATAFSLDDPNSTTMVGNLAPIYYSSDGGVTWQTNNIVPSQAGSILPTDDITVRYADGSETLYCGDIDISSFQVLVQRAPDASTPMTQLFPVDGDQPYVQASTVLAPIWSPDVGKDRVYVGENASGVNSTMVDSLSARTAAAPAGFSATTLDTTSDFPSTRTAIHTDGTVYVAFLRRTGTNPMGVPLVDVVVRRDNNWGQGSPAFSDLHDPISGAVGSRVVIGTPINIQFSEQSDFGNDRYGSDLAIAVDPRNSRRVYIAWGDGVNAATYGLHVRYSTDGGIHWSPDVRAVATAKNPGLAINSRGVIGFSFQQVTGPVGTQRWLTQFERTSDNFVTTDPHVLANTNAEAPAPQFGTYLGDYMGLQAIGKDFYGVFSASNYPDQANFPSGVTYLRNVDWVNHQLLPVTGTTPVNISIDPFYYKVTDESVGADFYVRDWTDSATSGDNGAEPSTHADFLSTCDVWNQNTNTAPSFNMNDQPVSDPAEYGFGAAGANFAFTRIRRNVGGIAASVAAHFMVSEFGTGSNYADAGSPDPTDPDLTITAPDPVVAFAASDLGPSITPAYPWELSPTASTHLCLAVEIDSSGDHYIPPSLTGHAPGWPTTDLAIIADNNKAQRNLQVHAGMRFAPFWHYAVVHNAATFLRDVTLRYGTPAGLESHLAEAAIHIVDGRGKVAAQPFRSGGAVILPGMEPGENRWIGVTGILARSAEAEIPIDFFEMAGATPVNGFSIAVQPSPAARVIASAVDLHRIAFARLAAAFKVAGAEAESEAARRLQFERDNREQEEIIEEEEVTLEEALQEPDGTIITITATIDEQVTEGERAGRPHHVPAKAYVAFLRRHAPRARACAAHLIAQSDMGDPFDLAQAAADLEAASRLTDITRIASTHDALLQKLDAFITMLHKATGDPADILQTVIWQGELYGSLPRLRGADYADQIVQRSQAFTSAYEARAASNRDYAKFLADLIPLLHATDAAVGPGLGSYITVIQNSMSSVRRLQKAHRDFLLQLRLLAE